MYLQWSWRTKCFPTFFTFLGFLSIVISLTFFRTPEITESPPTYITCIWLPSIMLTWLWLVSSCPSGAHAFYSERFRTTLRCLHTDYTVPTTRSLHRRTSFLDFPGFPKCVLCRSQRQRSCGTATRTMKGRWHAILRSLLSPSSFQEPHPHLLTDRPLRQDRSDPRSKGKNVPQPWVVLSYQFILENEEYIIFNPELLENAENQKEMWVWLERKKKTARESQKLDFNKIKVKKFLIHFINVLGNCATNKLMLEEKQT